ncbi:universal stress protein [Halomonas sp. McH1-25]|uniref:universal stress protein n=1 Tax=unclassified Halomonas TaxID=2609666 RepID=UPI001EF6E754|nr:MULTISPECIES: universal stress protein [unclassified Halomonas]MCG7599502.1 universal stress protein [Halomonas sp. McH1-25]MCP1343657.1 universal stress protein [Halomonas sp. FL8]MCP1362680.1 universal stress protein [Halomonas sp. BBD45]
MPQTLLFACDLSAENRAAFARAIRLAVDNGAQLDVLHVLDPHLPRQALRDLETAVIEEMERLMTELREDYALPAPPTLIQTVAGSPYVEIIREAHERQASAIVLGAHRKRGQPELVGGTTLARVMRGAPCPVYLISHAASQEWQDILVPVDFSLACRHTLRQTLMRFPDARLTLLHTWHIPGEEEFGSNSGYAQWRDREVERLRQQLEGEIDQMMNELGDVPELELELEQGEPGEALLNRLRRQPPDLLALSSQMRLGRDSHLTERLLAEPHCDMMVCRAW